MRGFGCITAPTFRLEQVPAEFQFARSLHVLVRQSAITDQPAGLITQFERPQADAMTFIVGEVPLDPGCEFFRLAHQWIEPARVRVGKHRAQRFDVGARVGPQPQPCGFDHSVLGQSWSVTNTRPFASTAGVPSPPNRRPSMSTISPLSLAFGVTLITSHSMCTVSSAKTARRNVTVNSRPTTEPRLEKWVAVSPSRSDDVCVPLAITLPKRVVAANCASK